MAEVRTPDPGSLNVMALLIATLIRKGMGDPDRAARADKLELKALLKSAGMQAYIQIRHGDIFVANGLDQAVDVIIEGDLPALLDIGIGKSPVSWFLTGAIRVKALTLRAYAKLQPLMKILGQ